VHLVVNTLTFSAPVDRRLFARAEADLAGALRAVTGFRSLTIVATGEREVVLLIGGDDAEAVDRIATEVGSPWMREHVLPLLAAPPDRKVGEVLARVEAGA